METETDFWFAHHICRRNMETGKGRDPSADIDSGTYETNLKIALQTVTEGADLLATPQTDQADCREQFVYRANPSYWRRRKKSVQL